MIPWGEFSTGEGGEGDQILIGQLSREQLIDNPVDQLQSVALQNPADSSETDQLANELINPTSINSLSEEEFDLTLGAPGGGARKSFQIESFNDATILAGGSEDFGKLVSRLKRDGLDIVIVFDSTGSMQGEIEEVKNKIQRIGNALLRMIPKTRISICAYRDKDDEYIVKGVPLTDNLGKLIVELEKISASGGGDLPEAVDAGLRWAIEKNKFRRSARKVILLFGDAPPHQARKIECQKLAADFRNKQRGIVSTVTCRSESKLEDFEIIARVGGGESFLTRNEREIMKQLMVLVFGSQHRSKVLQAFDLLGQ
jgi:Mg-chelatase subunit ChlD